MAIEVKGNKKMEKIIGFFLEKIWPALSASAQDARELIQSNSSFFATMKDRKGVCSNAWLFGIFVAIGLGVLGLPASRSAGITPNLEFASVMTMMNWLLIAFYGVCFAIGSRLLGSDREMLVSVNTFFYVSGWLVVLKLFEMPALGARFKAMAESCTALSYDEAVTSAIQQSSMARISDVLVLVGYVLFIGFAIAKMQRLVHDFGWIRALLSTVIGMALLSAMVSYVQEPIISQLICSYISIP
ncbi:hypothetical protein [Pseudomonas sp. ICMP 561]|uniref:hypothetical protein n=1 Tax=Pseudomonas sp. ICMP 561 TaxID=1718918 RepID=UPI000C06863B|nr:hypothetical protein [Pseudomonas sp. ICMP 561]PHN33332.1 hypothetical protein AO242_21775 [Pseudomonas sp. ICMP 561]